MSFFSKSLTIKLGIILIIAQMSVLVCIGYIYIRKFSDQVDRRIESKTQIPGDLMNAGLLNINAMTDRHKIEQLVGNNLKDGIVVGVNKIVYSSIHPENIGTLFDPLGSVNSLEKFEFSKQTIRQKNELITISPILGSDGKTPRFFVYVSASTAEANAEKMRLVLLFVYGSLATLILTSFVVFIFFKYIVFDRLQHIGSTLNKVERGDLSSRISDTTSDDEIGQLGRSANKMAASLEENITNLQTEIEERHRAESALRDSELKYRQLIENANDAIFIAQYGKIVFSNKRTLELLQYNEAEIISIPFTEFIHPEDRDMVVSNYQNRLQGKQGIPSDYSFRAIKKDQSEFFIQLSAVLIKWNKNPATLNFARDITEQKKLEITLQLAKKMEVIGLMAGSVAHDLNNILTGITGYPELLLQQLPAESELRKPIEAIRESGNRAAAVVADLLTVARGVAINKVIANMNTLVKEYIDSPEAQHLRGIYQHIQFHTNLTDKRLNLSCSPVHIKKCIMNLVTNAAEAIENQGSITLSTATTLSNQKWARENNLQQLEYIVLTVTDTGKGIPQENIEHIFEPFYTKKVMGRSGTGLGLAVVWNTVKDHDGKIFVESGEKGTRFQLYFPLSSQKETELVSSEDVVTGSSGNEQILVVDDENHLCDIASQMLENLGYKVHTVSSGEKALGFVKKNKVDLVVLDMLMEPGIDGRETYKEILKLYPGQKAIIASGYSESEDVKETLRLGAAGFIKKPYSMNQLGQMVREALNS